MIAGNLPAAACCWLNDSQQPVDFARGQHKVVIQVVFAEGGRDLSHLIAAQIIVFGFEPRSFGLLDQQIHAQIPQRIVWHNTIAT